MLILVIIVVVLLFRLWVCELMSVNFYFILRVGCGEFVKLIWVVDLWVGKLVGINDIVCYLFVGVVGG